MLRQIVFLSFVIGAFGGGFNNRAPVFGSPGFGNTGFGNTGFGGNTASFDKSRFQATNQAEGSAAGAGNAAVGGEGEAQSVNTADHAAGDGKTQSKGQSLNQARGTGGVTAGGAAQAGGNTASQKQGEKQSGFQTENFGNFGNGGNFGGPGGFRGNSGTFGGGRPVGNIGGGFNNPRPGFNGGGGSSSGNQGSTFNKQTQSGGTAAGAGTASVVDGQATSNNNAEQFADENGTRESGSSLNAASGFAPNTQGAAQAGGNIAQQKHGQKFQNNNNRRWN